MSLLKLPDSKTGLIDSENKEQQELDNLLEQTSTAVTLTSKDKEIIENIINTDSKAELEKQFALFNINQSKKNALRIIKLEQLMDIAEDQAIDRLTKRPDQVSHRELLDYIQIVSNQIDRSQKYVDSLPERDLITPIGVSSKTDVTINIGTDYTKDNKENVIAAVKGIFNIIQKNNSTNLNEDIIDAEPIELVKDDEDEASDEDLYNPINISKDDEETKY